jgi:hypothetical protein
MKHFCEWCDIKFNLYYNFRKHLTTNKHEKKSNTIVTDSMLEELDKNRLTLLTLIYNSAFDV